MAVSEDVVSWGSPVRAKYATSRGNDEYLGQDIQREIAGFESLNTAIPKSLGSV